MDPWNDWYHVTGNTYGTWLPGDLRGWKTRHHRVHVDPLLTREITPEPLPETGLHRQSRDSMTRARVLLSPVACRCAADSIVTALHFHGNDVAVLAVTERHFHVLVRVPDRRPRHWIGIAKKEAGRALSRGGLAAPGGVWAVRTHCDPITDRAHQIAVAQYIVDHAAEGGTVWRCKR